MCTETTSCYICSEDESLSSVFLPDGEPVYVGRNVDTKITDLQCSRQQVRLVANYADLKVIVQQLGSKACGLNGYKTEHHAKIVAQHGDRLEILYGKYPYYIEFNPPPHSLSSVKTKKRLALPDSDSEVNGTEDSQVNKKAKKEINMAKQCEHESQPDSESGIEGDSLLLPSCSKETTNSNLSGNIFGKTSKPIEEGTWCHIGNKTVFMYRSKGLEGRSKIAAYDMDGTLIKTLSGLVWPKDCNDWQLMYPGVPGKLKQMYNEGYKVVILSNQRRLGVGKITVKDFKSKIEKIVQRIGIPMQVFLANENNIYRKPCTGMWDLLVNEYNDGVPVNKDECFYVGDAAGRPASSGKKKKDHSSVDRLLAKNLGLKFFTPEEHFLGRKSEPSKEPVFNPKVALQNTKLIDPPNAKLTSDKQEIIIMVGSPGSGKSHFVKNYLTNYHYVNRDTLGSWQKCVSAVEEALSQGKSVVVDNTNPDVPSRKRYIDVARKYKIQARCFVMAVDSEHIKHNNKFRNLTDPTHEKISDMIINSYITTESQLVWRCIRFFKLLLLLCLQIYTTFFTHLQPCRKNFVPPSESEGFEEIVRIHFVPKFQAEEERKLYEMYLLEN